MAKPITFDSLINTESHWDFSLMERGETGEVRGFVYRIRSQETGKFYLGSKLTSAKNWPKYTGSSKKFNAYMKGNPEENHMFHILLTASDLAAVVYCEAAIQIFTDAIHKKDCWNEAIVCRKWIRASKGTRLAAPALTKVLENQLKEEYML